MKSFACLLPSLIFCITTFSQSREIKWWDETTMGSEALTLSRVLRDGDNLYMTAALFEYNKLPKPRLVKVDKNGQVDRNELLTQSANGKEVISIGAVPYNNELYVYYQTDEKTTKICRDRIDKSAMEFADEEVKIMEGQRAPIEWFDPLIGENEQMNIYFNTKLGMNFIDNNDGRHVIVKRNSFQRSEQVEMQVMVIRDDLVTLNTLDIKLTTTNTQTRIYDIFSDSIGGVYLILGDFTDKIPVVSLQYYPPEDGPIQEVALSDAFYTYKVKGIVYKGGIIITGLRSTKNNQYKSDHFYIHINTDSFKITSETVLTDAEGDDLLYLITNQHTCLAFLQRHTPSSVNISNGNETPRLSDDIIVSLINKKGDLEWSEVIANKVRSPGGGILYDMPFPFVLNHNYYLLQTTHPETHEALRSNSKLKSAVFTKGEFATELVTIQEDGEIYREYIYKREEKTVTIPTLTRYLGDGELLFYGDNGGLTEKIWFGVMNID